MRAKVVLCFVLTLLSCSLGYVQKKNCSDCVGYRSCEAAVVAIGKKEPAADAQLKSAFCGFDGRLPMVCCSELTAGSTPTSESVGNHPNLLSRSYISGTRGENCSDCVGYRSCEAAVVAIGKKEPAADAQLRSAFCGLDGAGLPMVCCSELTAGSTPTSESVENHPNLSLLPATCGKINGDKIIGGRTAGLYEYPWMTLISYRTSEERQFKCGGSLINDRYVLTAAHCIVGLKLLGVRIGENDVDTTTDCQGEPPTLTCESKIQDIPIKEAIPHPDYHGQPALKTDIGLIRLKKPVDLSVKNAGVICLPVSKQLQNRNIGGLYATVAGWGSTEKGYMSSKLLAVDVPVHTAESCRALYNRGAKPGAEDETINKICAGTYGKDSCVGDSGGPMMVKGAYMNTGERFIQHGIVSYGPRLCGSYFPGVYTDVSKYMKWILDTIRP